jgi:hypothetical protein
MMLRSLLVRRGAGIESTEFALDSRSADGDGWNSLERIDPTGPWHPVYRTAPCMVWTVAGDHWPDTITRELWDDMDACYRGAEYGLGGGTDAD